MPIVNRRLLLAAAPTVLTALAAVTPVAAAPVTEPTLVGRALLAPNASAPAPFAGAPNTEPAPAPGARQPVGGFSALLDAAGKDTFWAMPDNGFGSKANSRPFLLRVYRVRADFETARGGSGEVEILDYLPTERLLALRDIFYPQPGRTLGGRPKHVLTQADEPGFEAYAENQLWMQSQVVFCAVHVVGSRNGLAPWFGAAETEQQHALRLQEYESRLSADLAWLERTFATAHQQDARGVLVAMQADTFQGSGEGFAEILDRITELAAGFDGPVLLVQGDSHTYFVDRPLPDAPNLTRIVVEGETADEWLRLRIDPRGDQLSSWTRERL